MTESETHNYKAGCGLTLHITIDKERGYTIRAGRSGSCQSIMWEVMAGLLNELPKEKVIKLFKGYSCEKAVAGNKSCFDRISRMLSEGGK